MARPTLEQARAMFPHRFTMEHVPAWANKPYAAGYYAPQYRTDQEWYDRTLFPGEAGHDGPDGFCSSGNPTWPLGTALDKPYTKE